MMSVRRHWEDGIGWVYDQDDRPYDETEMTGPANREPSYDELMDQFEEAGCDHEFVEGVDEEGNLIEPAFDVCIHCGKVRR
jgi:hypothetical protein